MITYVHRWASILDLISPIFDIQYLAFHSVIGSFRYRTELWYLISDLSIQYKSSRYRINLKSDIQNDRQLPYSNYHKNYLNSTFGHGGIARAVSIEIRYIYRIDYPLVRYQNGTILVSVQYLNSPILVSVRYQNGKILVSVRYLNARIADYVPCYAYVSGQCEV
jgi:hypothetical protein